MSQSDVPRTERVADGVSRATMFTPVGPITVTSNGYSIVRIEWLEPDTGPGQRASSQGDGDSVTSDPLLTEALRQLQAYFDNSLSSFDLPLDLGPICDTARTVLTTLKETVYSGSTVTYGELAARSGAGIHARGAGSVMG